MDPMYYLIQWEDRYLSVIGRKQIVCPKKNQLDYLEGDLIKAEYGKKTFEAVICEIHPNKKYLSAQAKLPPSLTYIEAKRKQSGTSQSFLTPTLELSGGTPMTPTHQKPQQELSGGTPMTPTHQKPQQELSGGPPMTPILQEPQQELYGGPPMTPILQKPQQELSGGPPMTPILQEPQQELSGGPPMTPILQKPQQELSGGPPMTPILQEPQQELSGGPPMTPILQEPQQELSGGPPMTPILQEPQQELSGGTPMSPTHQEPQQKEQKTLEDSGGQLITSTCQTPPSTFLPLKHRDSSRQKESGWEDECRSLRRKVRKLEDRVTEIESRSTPKSKEEQALEKVSHLTNNHDMTAALTATIFSEEELINCSRTGKNTIKCTGSPRPPLEKEKMTELERLVMLKTGMSKGDFIKKNDNLQKVLRRKCNKKNSKCL